MEQGRIVVITGAAGGMGSVFVDRFLANKDTVIATDTTQDALDKMSASRNAGDQLLTSPADISSEQDCGKLADFARANGGHVDVLVNCAGWYPFEKFETMTADQWRNVIDINLTGNFLVTRAILPLIKDRGWGRIVNIGSASVFEGPVGQAHYVSAKAGIIGLTRVLAREVGGYNITVNVVTPGVTLTGPVKATFSPDMVKAQVESRALHRDQKPEDLAGAVFFLASPSADFITGQILNVDGGKFMH